jgi:hypothetical protein
VLGEIPDRHAALKEIFDALKPGGRSAGLRETASQGNRIAFTLSFEKPVM